MTKGRRKGRAEEPLSAEAAKAVLEPMKMRDRREAVWNDVDSGARRFAMLRTIELARLLGVPDPEHPVGWDCCTAVEIGTLKHCYDEGDFCMASELASELEDYVEPERLVRIQAACKRYDEGKLRNYYFLHRDEREYLAERFANRRLQRMLDNGIGCVATYCVRAGRRKLWFRGDLEEDGRCLSLRGPYDGVCGPYGPASDPRYVCG